MALVQSVQEYIGDGINLEPQCLNVTYRHEIFPGSLIKDSSPMLSHLRQRRRQLL